MIAQLTRNWWMPLIRGIAAILFGVAALVWPQITLEVLVFLFGAFALADGVFALVAGIMASGADGGLRWSLVLSGIVGIGAGLITFFWPGVTATVLLSIIIAWAIISGVLEIVAALRMREVIDNEWLYILSGALSVLFGVLALVYPNSGALSIVWMIAIFAIAYGITLVGFAFRVRSVGNTLSQVTEGAA